MRCLSGNSKPQAGVTHECCKPEDWCTREFFHRIPSAFLFYKQPTALARAATESTCARSRRIPPDHSRLLYSIALVQFLGHEEPSTAGGLKRAQNLPRMPLGSCNRLQARHYGTLTGATLLQAGLVSSPQLGHMGYSPVGQVLVYNNLPALRLLAKEAQLLINDADLMWLQLGHIPLVRILQE